MAGSRVLLEDYSLKFSDSFVQEVEHFLGTCTPGLNTAQANALLNSTRHVRKKRNDILAGICKMRDLLEEDKNSPLQGEYKGRLFAKAVQTVKQTHEQTLQEMEKEKEKMISDGEKQKEAIKSNIQSLQEEHDALIKEWQDLQSKLDIRRSRALKRDGHFQVMDDDYSRDSMVKKYQSLYNEVDMISVKLEDALSDISDFIEGQSGAFFATLLHKSFEHAEKLMTKMVDEAEKTIKENLQQNQSTAGKSKKKHEGRVELKPLLEELLCMWYKGSTPADLAKDVEEEARKISFFQKIDEVAQKGKKVETHRKLIAEFVERSTSIAWHLTILPHTIKPEPSRGTVEFDPTRHTRHSNSNTNNNFISEILWPALIIHTDSSTAVCLCKGLVLTQDPAAM